MNRLSGSVVGPIIEAWEELRINRGRIILSLIGVAAAVWAMASVLALGQIVSNTSEQLTAVWNGRNGTVMVQVFSNSDSSSPSSDGRNSSTVGNDRQTDQLTATVEKTVELMKPTIWTRRSQFNAPISAPGILDCLPNAWGGCWEDDPTFFAVDPGYQKIFAQHLILGRNLEPRDAQLRMNPAVVNESMWQWLGTPDLASHPRFRLKKAPNIALTIVGVVRDTSPTVQPEVFVPYEVYNEQMRATVSPGAVSLDFAVLSPPEQAEKASTTLHAVVAAQLDDTWTVSSFYSDTSNQARQQTNRMITSVIAVIGGIVIALGALGLLTVSIVTVKQRVREIGIRRAMGASARRVFLSVFLESVVATTVAGFIGVALSVATLRLTPLDQILDLPVSMDNIPYPMTAALLGVLIAAGVGALAGIIPATIAIKIKPIDAIRY